MSSNLSFLSYVDKLCDFRPVGLGLGGSGVEFSSALGGNVPAEQFTGKLLCIS